jgi:hypothetical protein
LGIPLDENVKKSKDFDQALQALNRQFGGAAAARAETYAGKLDRTRVALSEAGEAIGTAFIPVIEDVSSLIIKGVGAFDDFNETTDGLAGKMLALGTVGLGAVSALSLVGGQAIKARDLLFKLDDVTNKYTLSLSKLGKSLVGAGALIGTAIVVYQAYADKKQQAEERTRDLADALKLEGEAQRDALSELAKNDDRTRTHINTLNLLGLTFDDVKSAIDGQSASFTTIRKALDDYQKRLGYTGAAEKFAAAIGYQGELTVGQINAIKELTKEIDRQVAAQADAADAYDATNRALGDLGAVYDETMMRGDAYQKNIQDFLQSQASEKYNALVDKRKAALDAQAESEKKATQAAEDFRKKVIEQAQAVRDNLNTALATAKQRLDDAVAAYGNYQAQVSAAITGTLSLGAAQQTATGNARAIADAQTQVADAQKKLNDVLADPKADPKDVAAARQDLADATTALNDALKQPVDFLSVFKNQETAATTFAANVQRLLDLGADQAVVDQLLASGADVGNQIASEILNGVDPAGKVSEINTIVRNTQKIADDLGTNAADRYYKNGVTLAENLVAGINSVLAKASIKLKFKALNRNGKPLKGLNTLTDLFQSEITGLFETAGAGGEVPQLADGGIVRARRGGTLAVLGEGGRDEAVVPLPAAGGLGGTTINVNVSAGMGADGTNIGRQIVDELVAYQRRVGALPIKVAG